MMSAATMAVSIQFLGAARHVTGSKHLLTVDDHKILLECGMLQGPRQVSNKVNTSLPLDPDEIDAVALSHAHIDHSGSLPRLVRMGYRGPIYCTDPTKSLLEVMLADSAHLQAADARYLAKRGHKFEPAYTPADVEQTLRQTHPMPYHDEVEVVPGVKVRFVDAGHILGSAQVVIDVHTRRTKICIAFTGDHGRKELPILRAPEKLPPCDILITESTYGNRLHPPNVDLENELERILQEETRDGGRVLIPAFSVGRTQNILLFLHTLMQAGRVPDMPIFVDSPLSTKATKIMARHADVLEKDVRAMLHSGKNPFFDGVRYVADVEESKQLNNLREGVIISASGMCEGGRILHHLKHSISRPQDCVLIVGYQAEGTLGRRLIEGHERVKIFGERYAVRCKVRRMNGLSAHADWKEMTSNLRHLAAHTRRTFVVHGEDNPAVAFRERLIDAGFTHVDVPVYRQKFKLSS
jgi:metallo-beta-lactamase family protein